MKRKALFFDVDGTLVDEKTWKIPQSTIDILKEVRKQGHKVFINSGRVLCMLESIQKEIEVDGLVCGCGTSIFIDGKLIYENKLPLERANEIKKALVKNNLSAVLEARERAYLPARPFSHERLEKLYTNLLKLCEVRLDSFEDESYTFDKFCILCDRQKQGKELENFLKDLRDFDVIDRGSEFFEVVPTRNTKGTGILKVLEYFDISLEDSYVFGDSMNDIPMFDCGVANRILMGVHDEGLETYASFITKPVLEDGIEYAIKTLGII